MSMPAVTDIKVESDTNTLKPNSARGPVVAVYPRLAHYEFSE